jgi:hypothetical protein
MTTPRNAAEERVTTALMDADVAAGAIGPISVLCVLGTLTTDHVDRLLHAFDDQRRRWKERYVSLTLLRARAPLPDDAVRKRVGEVFAGGKSAPIAAAVIDADGFWAAAARGVLAGLSLVSRRAPHPTRTLDEALRWAQARMPPNSPQLSVYAPAIAAFRDAQFALSQKPGDR